MEEHIQTTIKNKVLFIQLIHESKLNALSQKVIDNLYKIVLQLKSNKDIKVVVIRGTKKAFSAGVDINEFASSNEGTLKIESLVDEKWSCISEVEIPVIAQVEGLALGGGFELALMADIIVASDTAKFGFPEVNLGLMPGNGGTQKLLQTVGRFQAMKMALTGQMISAQDAYKLGLVTDVVPQTEIDDFVENLAGQISQKSTDSLVKIKRAISALEQSQLAAGLAFEKALFRSLFYTKNAKIGIESFLQKKPPNFD